MYWDILDILTDYSYCANKKLIACYLQLITSSSLCSRCLNLLSSWNKSQKFKKPCKCFSIVYRFLKKHKQILFFNKIRISNRMIKHKYYFPKFPHDFSKCSVYCFLFFFFFFGSVWFLCVRVIYACERGLQFAFSTGVTWLYCSWCVVIWQWFLAKNSRGKNSVLCP